MACWENAEETPVHPELRTMQKPSLKVREEMDVHQEILEASVNQRNEGIIKQSNTEMKKTLPNTLLDIGQRFETLNNVQLLEFATQWIYKSLLNC